MSQKIYVAAAILCAASLAGCKEKEVAAPVANESVIIDKSVEDVRLAQQSSAVSPTESKSAEDILGKK